MEQLVSRWGKAIDKERVWQEYPRPNLVRDSYLNLNGEWEYSINQSETGGEYDGTILVPFSPETYLSGVQRMVMPGDYLHYRKTFSLPEGFAGDRVLLHFGGVDQECRVFLNGVCLGGHKGGYTPFCFDVTDVLRRGENVLTLTVQDWTEKKPHARGKQKLVREGDYRWLFYTPQSGIWKTVWLESVAREYISRIKLTPLYDEAAVQICVHALGDQGELFGRPFRVQVLEKDRLVAEGNGETGCPCDIALPDFHAWSPETPNLYDVVVTMGEDCVRSYFGMRKFSVGRDRKGILRFYLNNEPFFFNGPLDQGYWPESLLTAPSDEALLYDIQVMKKLGYNTIRKHIKVEQERFYYHCDRLGMVVWQDMPNGGGEYDMLFVTDLPNAYDWFARGVEDNRYSWFKREDEEGRNQYYQDLENMVEELYNFPCIAVWVPFNEGWGQFDAGKATQLIRKLDPGRLVNEACGWFDQKGGDMYSIHNYVYKLKVKPKEPRVVALTEYGGYAYPVPGHLACDREFGYQVYRSREELTANYRRLWEEEIYPNLERGLSSAIYTQTSDIEEEVNGVMTYDRDMVKFIEPEVQAMNEKLYAMFQELTR